MSEAKQILDHGYLKLIERWGSDQSIIEGARMSTDKGFLGWGPRVTDGECARCDGLGEVDDRGFALTGQPYFAKMKCAVCGGDGKLRVAGDEKLLKYLWDNAHSTPFEMGGLTIEVQAPILVFREWHRHRVPFGYSELSARYTPMPNLNYLPTVERCMVGSDGKNKQAGTIKGADALTEDMAQQWRARVEKFYEEAELLYQFGLNTGLSKELARVVVPVGRYSRMRATGNLRGWLGFLKLRNAPTAQYEIRVFAEEVAAIIEREFPRTHAVVNGL